MTSESQKAASFSAPVKGLLRAYAYVVLKWKNRTPFDGSKGFC